MAEPLRLLFVCLGNICRSPLAEGALRARLQGAGLDSDIVHDSAGLGGWHTGAPPDPRTIAVAARHGVDIADLRARKLRAADYAGFDWLLCADRENLAAVRAAAPPDARAQAALLLPWAGQGKNAEIPDPYNGGEADFEHVWRLADAAAAAIVDKYRKSRSGA